MSNGPRGAAADVMVDGAARADVPALAALHGACFESAWKPADIERLLHAPATVAFLARIPGSGAAPCGFVVARAVATEAEILTLAVSPKLRRRGVGRALMTGVCAGLAARGVGALFLEVGVTNAAAAALYRSLGFRQAGLRKGYFARESGPGEDAILLRLDLARPPAAGGR